MLSSFRSFSLGAAVLGALALIRPARADETPLGLTLTSNADYSSGHYGETTATDIFSLTEGVQYDRGRWTLKLAEPYIHLSGPGTVIPGIGKAVIATLPPGHNEAGRGDTAFTASYIAHQSADGLFTLAVGADVKFGTADRAKGLGTGEDDFAGHTDIYWTHNQLTTFVTLGYRKLGNPPGSDLRDTIYGTVGWSLQVNKNASCGMTFSGSEKSSASSGAQAEVVAFATHKIHEKWNVQIYLMAGATTSSPDRGSGIALSRVF